ncbi:glycosyltransferase family 25 protein [Acidocella aromatica]|uniref:GR25 family glycosyltransferase involved in LPS biosynthesis n=1 Tax=Acidocella aromatica TaxID=1303579 RepID=A0A840VMR0_9PROT|nr:glycosyltransferase family 25 protein [Acidocella aromatica]MBB5372750.1 GR25 family glycosyltransferase involved in LPS biosynthesis [Acidocella aromatica]
MEYTIIDNFKAALPLHVKRALWRKGVENTHLTKATGASIAHATAWSALLESDAAGAIICEDDCIFSYNPFNALRNEDIYGDNIVFLNNRIANIEPPYDYDSIIYRDARTIFNASPRTIGADCYYIPKTVAKIALEAIEQTGFPAVIDLYLLKTGPNESKFGSICVDPAPGEHADEAYVFV